MVANDIFVRCFVRDGSVYMKQDRKSGFLSLVQWKRRYLALLGDQLHCYERTDGDTPVCSVDLSLCRTDDIEKMPRDCRETGFSKASGWRFAICTPDRRFIFAAESEVDMNEWVRALQRVVLNGLRIYIPTTLAMSMRNTELQNRLRDVDRNVFSLGRQSGQYRK
ncbi:Aste57867_317 [Aphanomyces stellatus]|uniref:Aste57867_317 protein n=1 Tax=Aphanomyces stellatus TaxID=120398 RepID=A0A485K2Q7_9STRA|nr:hypothetical protein As57867_000317 [Aphanomyces stellatus]VFT77543.1 Aste57867_317 [Aphanomyces stellatus]